MCGPYRPFPVDSGHGMPGATIAMSGAREQGWALVTGSVTALVDIRTVRASLAEAIAGRPFTSNVHTAQSASTGNAECGRPPIAFSEFMHAGSFGR